MEPFMSKFRQYKLELLMTTVILAPAAVGLFWLYGLGKMPRREPALKTRDTPSVIYDGFGFTDLRDGQKYKTTQIGNQVWTARDMNYKTGKSWCYNDSDSYCEKYGRLYDWETAITVCPAGWHLPSRAEWDSLLDYIDDEKHHIVWDDTLCDTTYSWWNAGTRLKSASGWYNWYGNNSGNGTDDYGFSALPGGYRGIYGFHSVGTSGYWWTATESERYVGRAHKREINYNYDSATGIIDYKSYGHSVRCVQDTPRSKGALP
jgi:uncharacterized protein (TIGR02145 family)